MFSDYYDGTFIGICLEWFLFGVYSGIFVIYLKYQLDKSTKATIVFYALCLLYVLSAATVVSDLVIIALQIEIIGTDKPVHLDGNHYRIDTLPIIFRLGIVQTIASGCCDLIAQCIMIHRCWIVWNQNIRVVIIPSFLAIAYMATWLGSDSQLTFNNKNLNTIAWTIDKWTEGSMGLNLNSPITLRLPLDPLIITSFAASMAVNTLVTGLIVFKILEVFLEVKPTSIEQSLGTTGGTKLQHIIFIIIESGMALFAIQLVRVVLSSLILTTSTSLAFNLTIGINQMLNGIAPTIILVRASMRLSFDDNESFKETAGSLRFYNPPSDPNSLLRVPVGNSLQSPEEPRRSEDICFDDPPNNSNTLRQSSNT